MAIEVQALLQEKAKRFGASAASADFQQLTLDSINYVLDDIDERLGLSTARVTATNASIDLDEQDYRGVISLGLDVFIGDGGSWSIDNADRVARRYEDKLKHVHMNYLKSIDLSARFGDLDS